MRVEVLAIGTELLLGQITDTNSSWIGEQLALAGLDSLLQTKVGDNVDRIAAALARRSIVPTPSSAPGASGRPRTISRVRPWRR